jgi:hypothetical protein
MVVGEPGYRPVMTPAAALVVVVAVLVTLGLIAWFVANRHHPENAAGHPGDVRAMPDRPAGPGAEADGVAGPGQPAPGPTTRPRDVVPRR